LRALLLGVGGVVNSRESPSARVVIERVRIDAADGVDLG